MSEQEYWQTVRDLADTASGPKHEIREDLVNRVHTAHDAGEPWAAETLTRWSVQGADRDYTRVVKDMNTVTYVRRDGRRVRRTVAYSMPKRSKEDGAIEGRQMQAWWGMSRAAVESLRMELFAQAQRLTDSVTALDQLLSAMDEHPECRTAREAWEAAGRSLDEIDLGEVAA